MYDIRLMDGIHDVVKGFSCMIHDVYHDLHLVDLDEEMTNDMVYIRADVPDRQDTRFCANCDLIGYECTMYAGIHENGIACDFMSLRTRDFDEAMSNINKLREWIMKNVKEVMKE